MLLDFCKMHEDKKIEIMNIAIQYNSLTQMHCRLSPLSYVAIQVNTKTILP